MTRANMGASERMPREHAQDDLRSSKFARPELRLYTRVSRTAFVKERRLNLRLSSLTVEELKSRAHEEGLHYQTLIASVLHKFITGRLVEKPAKTPRR
jgi:predicted DNA binding CopG/RHH family protein